MSNVSNISTAVSAVPQIGDPNPVANPVDWTTLSKTVRQLHGFYSSLSKNEIVTEGSFVSYDEKAFCFRSRLWLAKFRDEGAKFDKARLAFTHATQKCQRLQEELGKFIPSPQTLTSAALELFYDILKTVWIVNHVAKYGLEQLAMNYESDKKVESATFLRDDWKENMKSFSEVIDQFFPKVVQVRPDLRDEITLQKLDESVKQVMGRIADSRMHLRAVRHDRSLGVVLPSPLIEDSLADWNAKPNLIMEALQAAAVKLDVPKKALPIPDFGAVWMPKRAVKENGQWVIKDGVHGTCEGQSVQSEYLCNCYVINHPRTQNRTYSCAAVDSAEKAEQLACLIADSRKEKAPQNRRLIVPGLLSFWKEKPLIDGVLANRNVLEGQLAKNAGQPFVVVPFNLAFNAAARLPYEDGKSFRAFNAASLVMLAQCLHDDTKMLLDAARSNGSRMSADDFSGRVTIIGQEIEALLNLLAQIKSIKEELGKDERTKLIDTFEIMVSGKKSVQPTTVPVSGRGANGIVLKDDDEDGGKSIQFHQARDSVDEVQVNLMDAGGDDNSLEQPNDESTEESAQTEKKPQVQLADLPPNVQELLANLTKKEGELAVKLQTLHESVAIGLPKLEGITMNLKDPFWNKMQLLFQTLERLMAYQLNVIKQNRCAEIELLLFFCRLLDADLVISDSNGLDRSGFTRALYAAQVRFEEIKATEMANNSQDARQLAVNRMIVRQKLFEVIVHFDESMDYLFKARQALAKTVPFSKDLVEAAKMEQKGPPTQTVRHLFLAHIDGDQTLTLLQRQLLKDTLLYSEWIFEDLVRQLEVSMNSTGLAGHKLNQDANIIYRMAANSYPLYRLPPFAVTDSGHAIQLTTKRFGWLRMTPATMQLLLRLSQYRG